jgi:protein-disulfide isomerase
MKPRQLLALSITLTSFAGLSAIVITQNNNFKKTHFRVGSVPQAFVNQLIPKDIPPGEIRPPAIRPTDFIRYGSATSVVSVIEYGDFQCEACKSMAPVISNLVSTYNGKVRFMWRDFPIEDQHPDALNAAIVARCAGLQGKFWDAYDALMAAHGFDERTYRDLANRLHLDLSLFSACRQDPAVADAIHADFQAAKADGIKTVPFIFVGTKQFEGVIDPVTLKSALDAQMTSL